MHPVGIAGSICEPDLVNAPTQPDCDDAADPTWYPDGHVEHEDAPAALYLPVPHDVQDVAPVVDEYVPAGHAIFIPSGQ